MATPQASSPDPETLLKQSTHSPDVRLAMKFSRYRRNMEAFFTEQLKIKTKDKTKEPLLLWPCQRPVMDKMNEQMKKQGWIRLVVLKARQTGLSTVSEAVITHRSMLHPFTNGVVVAHDKTTATALFAMSKFFYDNMDEDIRPMRKYSTKTEFQFSNPDDRHKSRIPGLESTMIITHANDLNPAIGRTVHAAHLSEAARYINYDAIVDGLFPALASKPGTVAIIESTAKFSGAWFRDMCERAQKGYGDYWFVFVEWWRQPDYRVPLFRGEKLTLDPQEKQWMKVYGLTLEHIKFFRKTIATMGDYDLFRQNYPLTPEDAWVTRGDAVFPWSKLDEQRKLNVKPPERIANVLPGPVILDEPLGKLKIWTEPIRGVEYDVGIDVAMGGDEDEDRDSQSKLNWSVACVLRRGTNEQVAEWRSRSVNVIDLASTLYWLGMYYNQAQLCVEYTGIGNSVVAELSRLYYPNQYRWRYRDEATPRMSKKVGWECVAPWTKILTADLRWVPAKDLNVDDEVIGCLESPNKLLGARLRLAKQRIIGRKEFTSSVVSVKLSNGVTTQVSDNHPFWVLRPSLRKVGRWIQAKNLQRGDIVKCLPMWETIRTYDSGRLSAFLDGEGHLSQGREKGLSMLITQAEGLLADEIYDLWGKLGFEASRKRHFRIKRPHEKPLVYSGLHHTAEVLRALGSLRPTRLLSKFCERVDLSKMSTSSFYSVEVESVEYLGQDIVVGLETSPDHTLIADGVVSHNTSPRMKRILVAFSSHELSIDNVIIKSEVLLNEMRTFIREGDERFEAASGAYDDCVMAWMIALVCSADEDFERWYRAMDGREQHAKQMDPRIVAADEKNIQHPWNSDPFFLKPALSLESSPWD